MDRWSLILAILPDFISLCFSYIIHVFPQMISMGLYVIKHYSNLLSNQSFVTYILSILIEQVTLNLSVISTLHNTTNAYYRCALINTPCALDIFFLDGSAAVLVTPAPQQVRLLSFTYFREMLIVGIIIY